MAITIPSYDSIASTILANYRSRFPARDLSPESFLNKLARAEAMEFLLLAQSVSNADSDSPPSGKSSTAALDQWSSLFGLSSNTGGYGRNQAVAALGLTGALTGVSGSTCSDAGPLTADSPLLLTGSDGVTQFRVNGGGTHASPVTLTIPGSAPATGSLSCTIDAVTPGSAGNLASTATLTWVSAPSGFDATVKTTAGATTLGLDQETNAALLTRILARTQTPPKAGVSADFRTWAQSVANVNRAYVYPLRHGLGTVDVVVTTAGSGRNRIPSAGSLAAAATLLNGSSTLPGLRNVAFQGAQPLAPVAVSTGGLTIRVRVNPSKTKYLFDWNDANTANTVASYSVGTGAGGADVLTLTTGSAALYGAIANSPRIQVLANPAVGTPTPNLVQCKVTALDAGTEKICTLQTPLPPGWTIPIAGDLVYAGGPICSQISTAILAYIDGLGPSRASSYADAYDYWEDRAAVSRIAQIALDQKDVDGSALCSYVVAGAVTIAYGAGAATAADYVGQEITISLGVTAPQLLWAKYIVVTQ